MIARAEPPQGQTNAISTHVLVQPSSCPPVDPFDGISRGDSHFIPSEVIQILAANRGVTWHFGQTGIFYRNQPTLDFSQIHTPHYSNPGLTKRYLVVAHTRGSLGSSMSPGNPLSSWHPDPSRLTAPYMARIENPSYFKIAFHHGYSHEKEATLLKGPHNPKIEIADVSSGGHKCFPEYVIGDKSALPRPLVKNIVEDELVGALLPDGAEYTPFNGTRTTELDVSSCPKKKTPGVNVLSVAPIPYVDMALATLSSEEQEMVYNALPGPVHKVNNAINRFSNWSASAFPGTTYILSIPDRILDELFVSPVRRFANPTEWNRNHYKDLGYPEQWLDSNGCPTVL